MFLKVFLNYILGYVNIKVESYFIERFINICTSKGIKLWNIKRKKSSLLYANISIKDYKNIRSIARKTKSRILIKGKKGLPFIINKYKRRKVFVIFLSIIIIGLIVVSNFLWNIDIKGNNTISNEELIHDLKRYGLETGKLKKHINVNEVINEIRLNRRDIAWIGINIDGTNAIVEVKEASKAPEIINNEEYCNIISDKIGMITKINVQNGTANVKEGDIIKEGDILVNGFVEGKYTGVKYVHAKAEIEAKIWYSKKKKAYLSQIAVDNTGNTENKYSIKFNNFQINLYKTLSKFQKYDTIKTNKKIKLFSNFYLPIEIIKITNNETIEKNVIYTEEEITYITQQKIEEELQQEIENKNNIINKQCNIYKYEGYIEVEIIYEVLESIGSNEKIVF